MNGKTAAIDRPDVSDHPAAPSMPETAAPLVAALQVTNVSKRYGSGETEVIAVNDVSLTVATGEVVLIMGPSGSGKTTLLLILGALLRPTEGKIELDGVTISELAENRLPDIRLRKIGFVFQDFNLLSALTALDNVALVAQLAGMKGDAARQKATALLTELGMGKRLNYLPEKLSGGEKQRIAVARALVNDPLLILADEPTANLDSKIGHEITKLLQRIAKEQGRSVLIVSHDQRIKDIADRVLWLEDGQFKDMVEMPVDPVCAMPVERDKAIAAEWNGQTLYFCSRGCRDEFMADPASFAPGNSKAGARLNRQNKPQSGAHPGSSHFACVVRAAIGITQPTFRVFSAPIQVGALLFY